MANFTKEQIEKQICDQLVRDGFPLKVARSAAIHGADHYTERANATVVSSIAYAKTYAKPLKKIKDKPEIKKNRR